MEGRNVGARVPLLSLFFGALSGGPEWARGGTQGSPLPHSGSTVYIFPSVMLLPALFTRGW